MIVIMNELHCYVNVNEWDKKFGKLIRYKVNITNPWLNTNDNI